MNTLRTPIALLVVVVVALIAWFVWAHDQSVVNPVASQAQNAAKTSSTAVAVPEPPSGFPAASYPDEDTVASNIAGVWQSTDDANYSVDITSNGKWTDSYQGANASSSTSEAGTYVFFTSQNPDPDFTGTIVPGVTYLKVTEGNSVLYYSVIEADGDNLQITYLDRGNALSFVREE